MWVLIFWTTLSEAFLILREIQRTIIINVHMHSRNVPVIRGRYEGWNFNSGNYLFTTDTK